MTDLVKFTLEQQKFQETIGQQIMAANPNLSFWASANAGAGKTKVLIDRIARLLLSNVAPDKILAITYTKAAAAEMTSRLFETLGKWAIAPNDQLRKALQKLEHLDENNPPPFIADEKLQNARTLFARALETPGGLKIQTIHAFCGNILKRFPIEAGIAPGFEVAEDIMAMTLKSQAYEIAAANNIEVFSTIAANSFGTNDQEILANAIKYCDFSNGFDKNNIANQLAQRFGISPEFDENQYIEAANKLINNEFALECCEILRDISGSHNLETAQYLENAVNNTGYERFLSLCLLAYNGSNEPRNSPRISLKANTNPAIIRLLGQKGSKGLDWAKSAFLEEFIANVHKFEAAKICKSTLDLIEAAFYWQKQYEKIKRESGKLDFDDLLKITAKLFESQSGIGLWAMYKLDQNISHILIDESQDTSAAQWDLINPLFEAIEQSIRQNMRDENRSQFVVGDDKQSIYRFQGASPSRYNEEREKFIDRISSLETKSQFKPQPNRNNIEVDFKVSFRSGVEILKAVDKVWDYLNPSLETKSLNEDGYYQNHFSNRYKENSVVELWPLIRGPQKDDDIVLWKHPLDAQGQTKPLAILADTIAKEIEYRIRTKQQIWAKNTAFTRDITPDDIMILVKRRGALFHQIIKKLKQYGVKVAGADTLILKEEPAILDILALMQFALRPEDEFNLACVLKGAFCNLTDDQADLFPLLYKRENNLWVELNNSAQEKYKNTQIFLNKIINETKDYTPFQFLSFLLDNVHFETLSGWDKITSRFGTEAIEAVEALIDIAMSIPSSQSIGLHEFIDLIENRTQSVKRELEGENLGVRIMTVHGSKGREAPIVILPDTTSQLPYPKDNLWFDEVSNLPIWAPNKVFEIDILTQIKEDEKQKVKEEDNRLLYVGMTRARDRLILCGHEYRNGFAKNSWYETFENTLKSMDGASELELQAIDFNNNEPLKAIYWGQEFDNSVAKNDIKNSKLIENNIIPDWYYNQPPIFDPPPKRVAPSALIEEKQETPSLSPLLGGNKKRFRRGSLIHYLLENLPKIPAENMKSWAIARLLREPDLDDNLRYDICNEALKIVQDQEFGPLFNENSRGEVAIIGSSENLPKDIIINGIIDRLVVTQTEVLILDFKTNRPPPSLASDIQYSYIAQMAAYREVLKEAYKDKIIRCALLWTDTPLLMEIEQHIMDDAIKHMFQAQV